MTELEHALLAVGRELDLPEPPELAPRVLARLEDRRPRRVPRLALALALVAVAVAVAFAVPPARSAILRFLHLGAARIEFVDTLPRLQERPLAGNLGYPTTPRQASEALGFTILLPPLDQAPRVYVRGPVASVLLRAREPVLLSELRGAQPYLLKKAVPPATSIETFELDGSGAIWIRGAQHEVMFPQAPPRLAGNVLLWQRGNVTLRLEGAHLTRKDAVKIARSLREIPR